MATMLVGKYERKQAIRHTLELISHQSNRIFQQATELDDVVKEAADPDKVFGRAKDLGELIVEMTRLVQVWRVFAADLEAHPEPDEIEDTAEPTIAQVMDPEQTLVIPAPSDADPGACTCPPHSAIHEDVCPRGNWLKGRATANAAAKTPDDDIPF